MFAVQHCAYAQLVVPGYPVPLTQYINQLSFQNPSFAVNNNNWETSVTSRRNTGFWRNNQTYFLSAATRIQKNKKTSYHGIGMLAYYDKEGIYLKRYRGYLLYSYHLKLSKRIRLSGGATLGLMSYQVGNNEYEGGTSNGFDGCLGFKLTGKNYYLAAQIAQLPQSRIQPINEITELKRFYQIMAGKDFLLNKTLTAKANVNTRLYNALQPDLFLQGGLVWQETVGLYALYKWKRHASLMLGLEKIKMDDVLLKAFFSYDVPTNGDIRYQAFEISLQCVMPEKKK